MTEQYNMSGIVSGYRPTHNCGSARGTKPKAECHRQPQPWVDHILLFILLVHNSSITSLRCFKTLHCIDKAWLSVIWKAVPPPQAPLTCITKRGVPVVVGFYHGKGKMPKSVTKCGVQKLFFPCEVNLLTGSDRFLTLYLRLVTQIICLIIKQKLINNMTGPKWKADRCQSAWVRTAQ